MRTLTIGLITGIVVLWSAQFALAQKGDAATGKAIFTKSCSTCHGADGNSPKEAIAKMLKAEIPHLGSKDVQAKSDDELKKVITEGYQKMKPIKGLSDKDVNNVIAFLRAIRE
jgi:mono/diheme cytochrome c family protein